MTYAPISAIFAARWNAALDRSDGELWHNFRWFLGIMLGGFAGVLAVVAHGFHWF
jgi:hypothetical protein